MKEKLASAQKRKADEFYTPLSIIEDELVYYDNFFLNKVVYCNCDDPLNSNFVKYFIDNFERLGLRKLIATGYNLEHNNKDPLTKKLSKGLKLEYTQKNGAVYSLLEENGDFRNLECFALLQECDIVCTNPPFSLFREYLSLLVENNKPFLVIGSLMAVSYRDIFSYIHKDLVRTGYTGGMGSFDLPDHYNGSCGVGKTGIVNYRWFTSIPITKPDMLLKLSKSYTPEEYPTYDNYNAINVDKVADTPVDYHGIIGVPITYIDKHNSSQFRIIGLGRVSTGTKMSKTYTNALQHNKDGSTCNGFKCNDGVVLVCTNKPKGVCYTADNAQGYIKIPFARILIQKVCN
jgi:hypothetical protein